MHLRSTYWQALVDVHLGELKDELVRVEDCAVTNMLCKFEQVEYIHHFTRVDKTEPLVSFELPRLSLEFELQSGNEVMSREYDGYRLRHCQQLVGFAQDPAGFTYTLNGFHKYLILERSSTSALRRSKRADVVVLVPAGEVHQTEDGKISVSTSEAAAAKIEVRSS